MGTRGWFQRSGSSSFELLRAEGDSVERFDRNVLRGTFCFQLLAAFPGSCTPPRKTPSTNYISPKNTWPKLRYPEYPFP